MTNSFGQTNVINTTGNVGIGTLSPTKKLHVVGATLFAGNYDGSNNVQFATSGGSGNTWELYPQTTGFGLFNRTNNIFSFFVTNDDKVGVGAIFPTEKLSINGNLGVLMSADGSGFKLKSSYSGNLPIIELKQEANDGFLYVRTANGVNVSRISGYPVSPTYFLSNVGIGTTSPTEKLSVNGNIRAREIKVETNGWSDFVFAKDYVLPTLADTEKHIKEKGHLPGIPSAAEVEKNGIELGDMNKKLLQKIEELTLYLIEIKKQNEAQNQKLHSEIESLKSKIR